MSASAPDRRGRMWHRLKCAPEYFEELAAFRKNFEVRFDDRGYGVGSLLLICEYDADRDRFSGRHLEREVLYVLRDFEGLQPGWVVLGLRPVEDDPWVRMFDEIFSDPLKVPAGLRRT